MKIKFKLISILLCFSIVFSTVYVGFAQKAQAVYPVSASIANMIPEGGDWMTNIATFIKTNAETIDRFVTQIGVTAAKISALLIVQKATQAIIGSGESGIVSDWNNYLYVAPQQQAMVQMNSFFNTVSKGRLSTLNYEGVGMNYDSYLVKQAKQSIGGQAFTTNLQEQVSDPGEMFSTGNMKGVMTYMQCANNPACYTLVSTAKYQAELSKATEVAKNSQKDGFLPVKVNGKIRQPAAIVASALSSVDKLGTEMILNADSNDSNGTAITQISAGAAMSVASRSFNYMLADSKGKKEIQNKNDQYPFSLSYNVKLGVGFKIGNDKYNTGAGAINFKPPGSCTNDAACNTGTITASTYVCKDSKCVKR